MRLQFLGHACWLLEAEGERAIIDPFLTGNPSATTKPEELRVDYILLTHAHSDHDQDALALAKRNDALVIATFEIANRYGEEGVRSHPMHVGGKKAFPFGYVRLTPAFHGAGIAGGHAAGIVIDFHGVRFYHAGDTALYSDMKLLNGVIEPRIDVAAFPIGGNFTMDVADAALAARWVNPRIAVPMHYNTWELIAADPEEFKRLVEGSAEAEPIEVRILRPGEAIEVAPAERASG